MKRCLREQCRVAILIIEHQKNSTLPLLAEPCGKQQKLKPRAFVRQTITVNDYLRVCLSSPDGVDNAQLSHAACGGVDEETLLRARS